MEQDLKEITFSASTIETVDQAMLDYVDKKLNIFATTNQGFRKVPIIWCSAERAFQYKSNIYRDDNGALILPLITIERTATVKDPSRKGTAWAHIPPVNDEKGGTIVVARRIQQYTTSKFANADSARLKGSISAPSVGHGQFNFPRKNKKVVYETISIPMPVYINVTYSVKIRTEYQQQMNEILTPFITRPGQINYFTISCENHKFEGFMPQDFTLNNNVSKLGENERAFETQININVLAYLIGDGPNAELPKMTIRENAVEVVVSRERVIVGDSIEHIEADRTIQREI